MADVFYTQDVRWKTITNHKLESETKNQFDAINKEEHIIPGLLLKSIESMHNTNFNLVNNDSVGQQSNI